MAWAQEDRMQYSSFSASCKTMSAEFEASLKSYHFSSTECSSAGG